MAAIVQQTAVRTKGSMQMLCRGTGLRSTDTLNSGVGIEDQGPQINDRLLGFTVVQCPQLRIAPTDPCWSGTEVHPVIANDRSRCIAVRDDRSSGGSNGHVAALGRFRIPGGAIDRIPGGSFTSIHGGEIKQTTQFARIVAYGAKGIAF